MFMSTSRTVIIGATELLEVLRESAAADGEVLSFSDTDPIQALDAITAGKPAVVVIERLFAATSRGAALINRIKADPSLASLEIRVASVDGTYRISPRRAQPAAAASTVPSPPEAAPVQVEAVADAAAADAP